MALVACATWVLLFPLAFFAPTWINLDPFSLRGTMLPLAVGGILLAIVGFVTYRWRRLSVPVATGLFAAWIAFTLRAALNGTPYGLYGMTDDAPRLAAMATRFSTTIWPSDGIVGGVPTEYPPLFPWIIGRISALTGVPAWQLLPKAEVVFTSVTILVAFLLWNRLLRSAPLALAISVIGFTVYHSPWKAYEVLAIAITVPWLLLTFSRPASHRLHWLASGAIGGFLLLNYQGYLMYPALGILALTVMTWRTEANRRAYVLYLVRTLLLAAIVASPFLIPLGWTRLTGGGQYVADLYPATSITQDYLPFLTFSVLGVIQLAGLVGMIWLRNTSWWAKPLLVLTLGTYTYRLIYAVYFVFSGHTGMIHHAAVMTDYLFAISGILTLYEATRWVLARLQNPPQHITAIALTVLTIWTGIGCWSGWSPNFNGNALTAANTDGQATQTLLAFTEPSPSGHRARKLHILETPWFPVTPIRKFVEARLGAKAQPRTLSYDERLFSYLPWNGYTTVDRTATMSTVRWDDRYSALMHLSQTDPTAFAQASAHTRFGAIDVFILRKQADGWAWMPWDAGKPVVFQPQQFDRSAFDIDDTLSGGTVVAVRRPT